MRLLVNTPLGTQEVIEIGVGGYYFEPGRVIWDERVDGELPAVELGGMVRRGNVLEVDPDMLAASRNAASPVPYSVTPRQVRQAMNKTPHGTGTLREAVEALIAGSDQDTKDWYEFAEEFLRDHPVILQLAPALGLTDQQLDDLWSLAATL